jgi:hypothetical protein
MLFLSLFLLQVVLTIISVHGQAQSARLAGECASMCNDLRHEVLTLEICRAAKKTSPIPKVGDYCTTAMEQGFSDACVALCMDQNPVSRVAQSCRAAANEQPRPTVRRYCEQGYNQGFIKTVEELRSHFVPIPDGTRNIDKIKNAATNDAAAAAAAAANAETTDNNSEKDNQKTKDAINTETVNEKTADNKDNATVIPVTIDSVEHKLTVLAGQNAEDAVVAFCREHMTDDVSACIRQLIPTVLEQLEQNGSTGLRGAH